MSNDVSTDQADRIEVSFGVDIDVSRLNTLKEALDRTRQGTVECAVAWDNLNDYYKYFLGRLEGECSAYMNIAKAHTKQQFGL